MRTTWRNILFNELVLCQATVNGGCLFGRVFHAETLGKPRILSRKLSQGFSHATIVQIGEPSSHR